MSLDNVKTRVDVYEYIRLEFDKLVWDNAQQYNAAWFEIHNTAGKKLVEIAQCDWDKEAGYGLQLTAYQHLIEGRIEGAEQKLEAFLDELDSKEESKSLAERIRFEAFTNNAERVAKTPESFAAFTTELKQWINKVAHSYHAVSQGMLVALRTGQNLEQFAIELVEFVQSEQCTLPASEKERMAAMINESATRYQFYGFTGEVLNDKVLNNGEHTPENFAVFKAELKQWMDQVNLELINGISIVEVMNLGLGIAECNNVSAEQFVDEFVEYVSSESPLPTAEKAYVTAAWEKSLRTALGSDPKLFGRMVDGKKFDWKSLRGKYVLINFAFANHDHNKRGLWEVYNQYHDKGLVIVSVFLDAFGDDPIARVKQYVENEQIPWLVISDAQTTLEGQRTLLQRVSRRLAGSADRQRSGEGKLAAYYYFSGNTAPVILVDKEGKIIMTNAMVNSMSDRLNAKLAEIFE